MSGRSRSRGSRGGGARKQRTRAGARRVAPIDAIERAESLLEPCAPPRSAPAVHVDADLCRVPDPLALLGLTEESARDPEAVRAAYVRELRAHPPEREPDTARALREARERLLDPERAIERVLGVLHAPDPERWGLTAAAAKPARERVPAATRIVAQLVLYALLEHELADGAGDRAQR